MAISAEMIKELRQATGAGVLACKKALDAASGDMEKATEALRKKGLVAAAKKAERVTSEGRIEAYVHTGNKLGALVEVNCETDFVARTEEFKSLCHELAMQVAAANPQWVSREEIATDVIEAEKQSYLEQIAGQNKPEHIIERIVEGKLDKFYQEKCLLEQPFIRDDGMTVQQLVTEAIAKMGENVVVRRLSRFQVN